MAAKTNRRGEAFYRELLAEQAVSGLNLREFAEAKGIKPATLYVWSRRLRARARRWEEPSPALVPIQVAREDGPREGYEVRLRGGRELRVPAGFDADELARLLLVLERC
jgi:transposase-like protein